jgi:agmatinase
MRLPYRQSIEDVDAVICGVPTDDAVSYRSGARFGPEAIRSQSVMLRPYNPELGVDLAETLSMVDFGDAPTVPGYHLETLTQIEDFLDPVHRAGVVPMCLGGDHSILIAELRAAAKVHGPLALVHLDAHSDAWDKYYGARYFHGTVVRRAVEEGLISPEHSIQAGMRGTLYEAHDEQIGTDLGLDVIPWRDLASLRPEAYGERVAARVGDRPAFVTFDIDFVDPGFAPGTGTPEVGGPSSAEALAYLAALSGRRVVAADCVEVAPAYDPGGVTALLAANACHLILGLIARGRSQAR